MEKRCKTEHCLGTPRGKHAHCGKCRSRKFRKEHPVKASYRDLKSNAKRRGIKFELTFGYWQQWCAETGYIELRSVGDDPMTVDRIIAYKGYVDGNLQMLPRSENTRKYQKVDINQIDPEKDVDSWWKNL